jgi:hypothetical protein
MKIYIASSWRNQHGVEMLTLLLRSHGHEVLSWVENNYGEFHNHVSKKLPFEEWVNSDESNQSFKFDTDGASTCDLFIYYAPGGQDACVELGIAFANHIPIIGLWAKGENLGLMRKACKFWYKRFDHIISHIKSLEEDS